jgi:hypothetical protein
MFALPDFFFSLQIINIFQLVADYSLSALKVPYLEPESTLRVPSCSNQGFVLLKLKKLLFYLSRISFAPIYFDEKSLFLLFNSRFQ